MNLSSNLAAAAAHPIPALPPPATLARHQPLFGTLRNPLLGKHFMNTPLRPRRPASTTVQELKARLASFEVRSGAAAGAVAVGLAAIDRHLPGGGLARGSLHEIVGADVDGPSRDAAAGGFAASLLARCAADPGKTGPVVWIARRPNLTQAGLAAVGLDASRLLLVDAPRRVDALWAFEEALRCRALAAVAAEIDDVDLTQSRRLQLAAELGGTTALLLRPPGELALPSAARTRWRIESRAGAGETPRWRVELARVQGGTPRNWTIDIDGKDWRLADETLHRDFPAHPGDRSRRKAG
ncbi:MAG: ImuA family protein [Tagaea sp.]